MTNNTSKIAFSLLVSCVAGCTPSGAPGASAPGVSLLGLFVSLACIALACWAVLRQTGRLRRDLADAQRACDAVRACPGVGQKSTPEGKHAQGERVTLHNQGRGAVLGA